MSNDTIGPIFIFASGQRCGSTLVQRLLSSHPDIVIWGEHDGVLKKIFSGFDRLMEWKEMFDHQYDLFIEDGYNNFIPNMNPPCEHMVNAKEQLIRNLWQAPSLEIGSSIWGFKEVLYGADIAIAIKELFPNAKIIHLTRNIFECFISLRYEEQIPPEKQPHVPLEQIWTRARTIECLDTWIEVNKSMLNSTDITDDWVFRLKYEDLISNKKGRTHEIAEWLGLNPDDFDLEVFKYKLYTDRHKGPDPRPAVNRSDLDPDEIALVTTDEILELSKKLGFDMTVS